MKFYDVYEVCPYCEEENHYKLSGKDIKEGIVVCKNCGKKIFLCSECIGECDFKENADGSRQCHYVTIGKP